MKTNRNPSFCCGAAVLLTLLPLVSNASEPTVNTAAQRNDQQTHVLFTGTDIQVLHQRSLYPVQGVEGGSFIIRVDDKNVEIPMEKNPRKLKVERVQRLTERTVTVANYKYERAYTPANDPYRNGTRGILTTRGLQEQAMSAENVVRTTPRELPRTMVIDGLPVTKMADNPGVAEAQTRLDTIHQSVAGSTEFHVSEMAEDLAKELYDALDVQFELSSVKPIRSPYMVIMAKYHEKEDPQHPQNWLFAKALEPIDANPKKMFVREGGFPPGFVVEKLQVHLYEKGSEIATDLSEHRAPLTRDEAHEYLVIEHLSAHKKDTIPARVALTKVPDDWASHKQDEFFRKLCYVKITKTGHVDGLFEDKACRTKVDNPYLEAVLKGVLFLPALENGEAIDSVVQIKPADMSQ